MARLALAIFVVLAPGCVAWQSSIDQIQEEFATFKLDTSRDLKEYQDANEAVLTSLASKAPTEEVEATRAALDAIEQERKLSEAERAAESARETARIRQENEAMTRALVGELVQQGMTGFLGTPQAGQLVGNLVRGQFVTPDEIGAAVRENMPEKEDDPYGEAKTAGISAALLALYTMARNKGMLGSSAPPLKS